MESDNTQNQIDSQISTPKHKGNITIYPAIPLEKLRSHQTYKIRTAAYVRVSTDSEQQEGSFV